MTTDANALPPAVTAKLLAPLLEALASDVPAVRVVVDIESGPATARRVFVKIGESEVFGVLPRKGCTGCRSNPKFRRPDGSLCHRLGCVADRVEVLAGLARANEHIARAITVDEATPAPAAPTEAAPDT